MCFQTEMKDILEKKEPIIARDDTLNFYLEDLLLAYKYNSKQKFYRDLNALKPFLSVTLYRALKSIADNRYCW